VLLRDRNRRDLLLGGLMVSDALTDRIPVTAAGIVSAHPERVEEGATRWSVSLGYRLQGSSW
jgi:hypothetical protein